LKSCRNCGKDYILTDGEFCSRKCEIDFWNGAGIDIRTQKEKEYLGVLQ